MKPRRPNPRGFGLLEVLAASTLLILTVTGVLSATSAVIRQREHQAKMTQGLQIAESLMESLLVTYSSHTDLSAGAHQKFFDSTGRDLGATSSTYRADWDISGLGGAQGGMRRIALVVSWDESGGRKSIRLVSDR